MSFHHACRAHFPDARTHTHKQQDTLRKAESEGLKPPKMEERKLRINPCDVVTPPVQLPPVNRAERTYFINQSCCEYW